MSENYTFRKVHETANKCIQPHAISDEVTSTRSRTLIALHYGRKKTFSKKHLHPVAFRVSVICGSENSVECNGDSLSVAVPSKVKKF